MIELKFHEFTHSHDPVVGCALEGVSNIIAGIRDISIIIHSPQGCASTVAMGYDDHETDFTQRKVACTRLFETDIIIGGRMENCGIWYTRRSRFIKPG